MSAESLDFLRFFVHKHTKVCMKAGTLYPLLHGLEEKQFLNSHEQEVLGKVRKYYQITPEGRKHLEQKKEEWKEYSKAVGNVLAMEV